MNLTPEQRRKIYKEELQRIEEEEIKKLSEEERNKIFLEELEKRDVYVYSDEVVGPRIKPYGFWSWVVYILILLFFLNLMGFLGFLVAIFVDVMLTNIISHLFPGSLSSVVFLKCNYCDEGHFLRFDSGEEEPYNINKNHEREVECKKCQMEMNVIYEVKNRE